MNTVEKSTAIAATLALALPGAALAQGHAPSGMAGKAGAPGQACKSLKVKGKKTAEQRAAFQKCIHDAVAKRKADHSAKAKGDDADGVDKPDIDDDTSTEARTDSKE